MYAHTQQYFERLADQTFRAQATNDYLKLQLVGTPDDCKQQIEQLSSLTGLEYLILEFSYGGMPYLDAERNMKIFASEVMPVFRARRSESG